MGNLSRREKWLMERAFKAGKVDDKNPYYYQGFKTWLNDCVADGVTVEMILAKEAPHNG